jgi:hypothetical protein
MQVHPEFPLEQTCWHLYEPFQLTFARHALQMLPRSEHGGAEATHQGLVLRAETETALETFLVRLQDYYGDQIRAGSATIRYHRSPELEEPHMGVRVRCLPAHFAAVKADLLSRGATILDEELTSQHGVVRAKAPLAKLMGYPRALAQLTAESAREVMWLSHYAPVDELPPDGRAA